MVVSHQSIGVTLKDISRPLGPGKPSQSSAAARAIGHQSRQPRGDPSHPGAQAPLSVPGLRGEVCVVRYAKLQHPIFETVLYQAFFWAPIFLCSLGSPPGKGTPDPLCLKTRAPEA